MIRFCGAELPILGRMAECHLDHGHDGPCEARLLVERSRGPNREPARRWYGITWGEGQPIELEQDPSIRRRGES